MSAFLPPFPLSPESCKKHGGHCFVDTGEVLASSPPQYVEVCKHCSKRRVKVPRDSFTYRDLP